MEMVICNLQGNQGSNEAEVVVVEKAAAVNAAMAQAQLPNEVI